MRNQTQPKPLFFLAVLLMLKSPCLLAEVDNRLPSVQDTLREIQRMNQSMFKINQLYISCKMQHECILVGLKQLVENDKDAIAKSILEDYQKNHKVDVKSLELCYSKELSKVNQALEPCMKDKTYQTDKPNDSIYQCLESNLVPLIKEGSILAQLTLVGYYQQHQKLDKVKEWQQKISTFASNRGNDYLQTCIKDSAGNSYKQE